MVIRQRWFCVGMLGLLGLALNFPGAAAQGDPTRGNDAPPAPRGIGIPAPAQFQKVSYHESGARTPAWQAAPSQVRTAANLQPEPIAPGRVVRPGTVIDEEFVIGHHDHPGDCAGCGDGYCGDGLCGDGLCGDGFCGDEYDWDPCAARCLALLFRNLEVNAGVHGFKGPLDFGRNGNFGFHEGVNFGLPLLPPLGLGWQIGGQAVHSNYEGHQALGPLDDSDRNQLFGTVGVFHHAGKRCPWSMGVAFDFMHDRYWDTFDFAQMRARLGVETRFCFEIGVQATIGLNRQEAQPFTANAPITYEPQDQFVLYLRREFCNLGELKGWAGLTAYGEGILGSDFRVPLNDCLSFRANFNYIIPRTRDNQVLPAQTQESWAIGMNLVWHPAKGATKPASRYRAMFPVADNGSFMLRAR